MVFGLTQSFDRPGGNLTGVTMLFDPLAPKKIQLLQELVPNAVNPAIANAKRRADNSSATFCLNYLLPEDQLAARRLILLSASVVSFLSVAFSSSRVFCKTLAQSLRPSCFVHAIRLP